MKKQILALIALLCVSSMAVTTAEAWRHGYWGGPYYRGGYWGGPGYWDGYWGGPYYRGRDAAIVGGIGAATGLIGTAVRASEHAKDRRAFRAYHEGRRERESRRARENRELREENRRLRRSRGVHKRVIHEPQPTGYQRTVETQTETVEPEVID